MWHIPKSTKSCRFRAAWVQVMAMILASITSRYFDLSKPLRSNSKARNSSSWANILSIYLRKRKFNSELNAKSRNTRALSYKYPITELRSVQPKTSSPEIMVNTIKVIVMEDRSLMVGELGDMLANFCMSFFFSVKFGRVNSNKFYTICCSVVSTLPLRLKHGLPM